MKKKTISILVIKILLLSTGLTYAYYGWSSDNTDVTFNIEGVTITYDQGTNVTANLIPTANKDISGNIKKTITVSANTTVSRFNLYLDINILPTELKDESFKWELYKGATLTNEGNFASAVVGTSIALLSDAEVTTTTDTYYLYIWIDGNMSNPNAMQNKNFDFTLRADATNEPPPPTLVEYIQEITPTNTTELYTVSQTAITADNSATGVEIPATTDYRYYGATPNNYIYYNCTDNDNPTSSTCELWRIIGVVNTYTPSKNAYEYRVKIIKDTKVGNMSWDTGGVRAQYGVNAWTSTYNSTTSDATLNTYLNSGTYWTTTLKATAKNLVESATWYLGGSSTNGATSTAFYGYERGKAVYTGDSYTRATSWDGTVGLMYPSDYGYAAGNSCATGTNLSDYDSTCYTIDWLNKRQWEWTITHYSSNSDSVFNLSNYAYLSNYGASHGYATRPVLYLKTDVLKTGGTGTSDNPYKIS